MLSAFLKIRMALFGLGHEMVYADTTDMNLKFKFYKKMFRYIFRILLRTGTNGIIIIKTVHPIGKEITWTINEKGTGRRGMKMAFF